MSLAILVFSTTGTTAALQGIDAQQNVVVAAALVGVVVVVGGRVIAFAVAVAVVGVGVGVGVGVVADVLLFRSVVLLLVLSLLCIVINYQL